MISFFCTAEYYSVMDMYHIFTGHSSVEGHLGCFHFLALVNRALMNKAEQVSVEKDIESFGNTLRSSIAGSYGWFIFNVLRILQTNFQSNYTSCKSSVNEGSLSPTFPQAFVAHCFIDRHSDWTRMNYFYIWVIIYLCIYLFQSYSLIPMQN